MAANQNEDISDEEIIIEKTKSISKAVTTAKPSLVTAQYGVKSPVAEQPKVKMQKKQNPKWICPPLKSVRPSSIRFSVKVLSPSLTTNIFTSSSRQDRRILFSLMRLSRGS